MSVLPPSDSDSTPSPGFDVGGSPGPGSSWRWTKRVIGALLFAAVPLIALSKATDVYPQSWGTDDLIYWILTCILGGLLIGMGINFIVETERGESPSWDLSTWKTVDGFTLILSGVLAVVLVVAINPHGGPALASADPAAAAARCSDSQVSPVESLPPDLATQGNEEELGSRLDSLIGDDRVSVMDSVDVYRLNGSKGLLGLLPSDDTNALGDFVAGAFNAMEQGGLHRESIEIDGNFATRFTGGAVPGDVFVGEVGCYGVVLVGPSEKADRWASIVLSPSVSAR